MFKIFGSPYSPRDGAWAFNYETPREPQTPCRDAHAAIDDHDLTSLWDGIPIDSHIVVAHTPPRNHRDTPLTRLDRPRGCEALRRALWRVRPLLAVCGHIHDGRGANIVTWDSSNSRYKESKTREWVDPGTGNNKQSLIDLTGRTGSPLDNDGSFTNGCRVYALEVDGKQGHIGKTNEGSRNETCIVNAAIMKSKYPHIGGKQYNKPIIVDVMLPVWDERDECR
ncbi:hypothetical protein VHEMI09977 [[Torrubiella] hemipterigena]|nr:hypothetical protein VHEMI09977 [[Torrubiella] hemipterigena]